MLLMIVTIVLGLTSYSQAAQTSDNDGCENGDIRLAGGPNEFEGRVEICLNREWGQVCGILSEDHAKLICKQIISPDVIPEGFQDFSLARSGDLHGVSSGAFTVSNVTCKGTESKLANCTFTTRDGSGGCDDNKHALVLCQDPVCFTGVGHARLVNITSAANNEQGDQRVEVCGETNYYRRGVCDDNWDNTDARVLCRELGLLIQDNEPVATFGHDARYIASALSNVSCTGNPEVMEGLLSHCPRDNTGSEPTCSFAGVICQGPQSLSNVPLAPTHTVHFTPVPSSITTSIIMSSTTDVVDLRSSSRNPPLLQISTKTRYTFPTQLNTKMVIKSVLLDSSPSSSVTSTNVVPTGSGTTNSAVTIGIALCAVGGVLVLLVVIVLVGICIVVIGRKKRKQKYTITKDPQSERIRHSTNPNQTTTQLTGSSDYEETERVLLNPIYKEVSSPADYDSIVDVQPNKPNKSTKHKITPYYSTPSPLISSKVSYNNNQHTRPTSIRDSQGYTMPHFYEDTTLTACNNQNGSAGVNGGFKVKSSKLHLHDDNPSGVEDTRLDSGIHCDNTSTSGDNPSHFYSVLEGPL